jgi:hypothetical protein
VSISFVPGSPSHSDLVVPRKSVPSAPLPTSSTQYPEDIVQLSQAAQIQHLAQVGESPSLIASSTGLSVSQVDRDLGITAPATGSVPASTPGHAAAPVQGAEPATGSNATAATSTPTIPIG